MLARDGIFAAKFRGCTARATGVCEVEPNGQFGRAFEARNAAPKLFSRASESSSVCRLTTQAIGRTKRFSNLLARLADIHRSGGKLLDNPCLTSRVRSGSLRVDWFARSLINPRAVRPLSSAEEKIKMRSEVFRDGYPDSSVCQLQESSDIEGSHR
jgi:hypothetical protein